MLYDMLENASILRVFAPLKYFIPSEILEGTLNRGYLWWTATLSVIFLIMAFINFEKRDLS